MGIRFIVIVQVPGISLNSKFVISLQMQAAAALDRYGVHMVVANILHTRKDQVLLVRRNKDQTSSASQLSHPGLEVTTIDRPADEPVIERLLVSSLVEVHRQVQR